MTDILRGLLPVAPTVFTDAEELDLEGQRRVVDYLVDASASGICVLANFSEQFSLTDDERDQVVEATVDQSAGRVPVCVATSAYSARVAAARSRRAQDQGAAMVMLMPPFVGSSMKIDGAGVLEFFSRVADAIDIPIMVQDAPMSPTPLPVELLTTLAQRIPQVRYAKIEVAQTAQKIRALTAAAGQDLPGIYDGEESVTLIPDLYAGAQGSMSSAMVPDVLAEVVRCFYSGETAAAERLWEDVLPLIQFENRQCGMRAAKILMQAGKIIRSDASRSPLPQVGPETRQQLLDLAQRKDALILRWA